MEVTGDIPYDTGMKEDTIPVIAYAETPATRPEKGRPQIRWKSRERGTSQKDNGWFLGIREKHH